MLNMIFSNILIFINLTYFSLLITDYRFSKKYLIVIFSIIGILLLSFENYPFNFLYGTLIMIIYYTFFIFLLFTGDMKKKILIITFFLLIATICEVLSANIINLLFGLKASDLNTFLYTITILLSNILTFVLLKIISKFFNLINDNNMPNSILIILALPISTLLLLINVTDYFSTFRNNILSAFIILGLLISNLVTIFIFLDVIKTINLENELKKRKMKYDVLQSLYNNNFNFLHEMISKLMQFRDLLSNKNYDELSTQIELLNFKLIKGFNIINSNSIVINSLLNLYISELEDNNINLKTVIEYNDFTFIDLETQTEIFSLIFDISIASCIKSNEKRRQIILKTKKIDFQIAIQCIYTCDSILGLYDDPIVKKLIKILKINSGAVYFDENDSNKYCYLTIVFTQN